MLLKLKKEPRLMDDCVTIHYRQMTHQISEIVEIVNQTLPCIIVQNEGRQVALEIVNILYCEAVDKKVFIYTQHAVYASNYTLKDLEETLSGQGFVRISKSMLVSIYKVKGIKADVNMKLVATLENKEQVIISRHYRDVFYNQIQTVAYIKEAKQ